MTHPRKAIRAAICDRLKAKDAGGNFLTAAEDKVFTSRIAPVTDEDYPAVLIYTREEKNYSDAPDQQAQWRKRNLSVVVEGLLRAGETIDDKLDDLAEQIESALDGWTIAGFESAEMTLTETDIDLVTENVKRPIGAVGMTYTITYRSTTRQAEVADEIDDIVNNSAPPVGRVVRPAP